MMSVIKKRIRRFYALLHVTHMQHSKESLLAGYGVESTLDLSLQELNSLIEYLEKLDEEKNAKKNAETRKLRHQALNIMRDIGIEVGDWTKVNEFMLNKHVCGCHLYNLSDEELDKFIYKLYAIKNKIKSREKELKRLSILN